MTKVASTMGLDLTGKFQGGRIPTLIEWCAQKMGRAPIRGEVIESDGVRVTPRKFRKKAMSEAIVTVIEKA